MRIRSLLYFLLAAKLLSCKKETAPSAPLINSFTPEKGAYNLVVTIHGKNFDSLINSTTVRFNGVPAQILFVSDTMISAKVPETATTGKISVTVEGRTGTSNNDFIILPGKWILKKAIAAPGFERRHELISFVIGNKAYAGLGHNGGTTIKDFWEYDPATETWTRKADCGIDAAGAAAMVINGKAYVVAGNSHNYVPCCPTEYPRQVWEYDPASNQWTRKNDFPFPGRWGPFGIGLNGKGYLFWGVLYSGGYVVNECWQYDPLADSWTQKANPALPATAIMFMSTGFTINNKIYLGTTAYGSGRYWFEYDPASNTWTRKADYPGDEFYAASGFAIGNKGYVAGGGSECWEYDPLSNAWKQVAFFQNPRVAGTAFTLNNRGYYLMGGYTDNDFWEFIP